MMLFNLSSTSCKYFSAAVPQRTNVLYKRCTVQTFEKRMEHSDFIAF